MLFVGAEDFLSKCEALPRVERAQERTLALCMAAGDASARESLVRAYLPLAAHVRRAPQAIRTLSTVYGCIAEVEKGVDGFDFMQEGEAFAHHLGWRLRQCITRRIAER